jgi:hypothetical protein
MKFHGRTCSVHDTPKQLKKAHQETDRMVWLAGIIGLLAGFAAGQVILMRLLKDKSRHELLNDKDLRWKYGLFNWLIAAGTCLIAIGLYRYYFPEMPPPFEIAE